MDGIHGAVAPALGVAAGRDAIVEAFPIRRRLDAAGAHTSTTCAARRTPATERRVGGQPPQNNDFIDAVYGNFPLMIALIALVTFVLLARAFRSLLLPPRRCC